MAEAYVLAGELSVCDGDFAAAFAKYEARMMPFILKKQNSAAKFASSFAPKTELGIKFRNVVTRLMRFDAVAEYFVGRDLRDDVDLPDMYVYPRRHDTRIYRRFESPLKRIHRNRETRRGSSRN